jgi:hypothetical protein
MLVVTVIYLLLQARGAYLESKSSSHHQQGQDQDTAQSKAVLTTQEDKTLPADGGPVPERENPDEGLLKLVDRKVITDFSPNDHKVNQYSNQCTQLEMSPFPR